MSYCKIFSHQSPISDFFLSMSPVGTGMTYDHFHFMRVRIRNTNVQAHVALFDKPPYPSPEHCQIIGQRNNTFSGDKDIKTLEARTRGLSVEDLSYTGFKNEMKKGLNLSSAPWSCSFPLVAIHSLRTLACTIRQRITGGKTFGLRRSDGCPNTHEPDGRHFKLLRPLFNGPCVNVA